MGPKKIERIIENESEAKELLAEMRQVYDERSAMSADEVELEKQRIAQESLSVMDKMYDDATRKTKRKMQKIKNPKLVYSQSVRRRLKGK